MAQIDWQSGRIDLGRSVDRQPEWCLVVAGDWAPSYENIQHITHDPMRFYGDLGSILCEADLAILNLEGVLGEGGEPIIKDGPHLRIPTSAIEGLAAVPFHLVCLANNHSLDFGPTGLAHTRQRLSERGIAWVGAGIDSEEAHRPFVTQVGGVRLAIVNAAEGEEGLSVKDGPGVPDLDLGRLTRQVTALRNEADVIIAILHAGREFVPVPPPHLHKVCRSLVQAGAHLVVGHHPHVPQGVELYHGRPIAYSLGNFVMWTPGGSPFRRLGYLFRGYFRGKQLVSAEIIPYSIQAHGLALLDGDDRAAFLTDLAWASSVLSEPSKVEDVWHAYCDRWLERGLAQDIITISSLLLDEDDLRTVWLKLLSWRRDVRARLTRGCLRAAGTVCGKFTGHRRHLHKAQGAAILRNRFVTPAHRELYLTALDRGIGRQRKFAPDWAFDIIDHWGVFVS